MKLVKREHLLDYVTYNERRDEIRAKVMALKKARRIHVGPVLTFLFENSDTMRYQIQEMMRAEQLVREADIRHEIDTYNGLLSGDPGVLACTLLIEIEDAVERPEKLARLLQLPEELYVRLEDGTKIRPDFDRGQVGEDRLSSVQYLKFDTGGCVPVAVGCDLAELKSETELTPEQRAALESDLR